MRLIGFTTNAFNIGTVYINPDYVTSIHEDKDSMDGNIIITIGTKKIPVVGSNLEEIRSLLVKGAV